MYKSKDSIERVSAESLQSHALPVIDYCDVLYDGGNVELLEELQKVLNKCLKITFHAHILTPTELVHTKAMLPTLEKGREYHIRLCSFKRVALEMYREKNDSSYSPSNSTSFEILYNKECIL